MVLAGLCFCCAAKGSGKEPHNTSHEKADDWIELGADLRLRVEYDNNRRLDKNAVGHERFVLPRFRARAGAKIKLTDDADFNLRFAMEPRYYIRPLAQDPQFIRNEVLIDKFNLTLRQAFALPLTVVVGRQDIKLGSGWLIAEGTPLDGSRTAFFDALRLTYNLTPDNTVDFVWVENHADSARWLKPFNDRNENFVEQDERGAILYFTNKTGKHDGIDAYFIYKQDHHRAVATGCEGEIYTPAVRKYGGLNEHWQYSMEFAPQFGHKNGKSLGAFAANSQLTYNYNDEKQNKVYFGYEYLSGDDDRDKNFDRGWARTDTWSVLYQGGIDSIDGRSYDNSNLHRGYVGWETNPVEVVNLRCGYNILFADDNTSAGGTGGMNRTGNFRGHLFTAMLKYKPSRTVEHRIEGELFLPDNFYNNDRNDPAVFVRYGFYLKW